MAVMVGVGGLQQASCAVWEWEGRPVPWEVQGTLEARLVSWMTSWRPSSLTRRQWWDRRSAGESSKSLFWHPSLIHPSQSRACQRPFRYPSLHPSGLAWGCGTLEARSTLPISERPILCSCGDRESGAFPPPSSPPHGSWKCPS